jgi:transglutaminase-like putative cysteine protease
VALVSVFALAILSSQLGLVRPEVGDAYRGVFGWVLAVLAVVFMFGHRIWPVAATLVPVIVGLLAASGLDPTVSLFPHFAVAGALALWAFTFMSGGPRRLGWPLATFLVVAAVVAAGAVRFLPWAQPHVERAVANTFADGTTGLSEESRLGEFGELAVSSRVVLRVWTAEPRLLRAYVHDQFDGREWSSPVRADTPPPPPLRPAPASVAQEWLAGVPGPVFVIPPEEDLPTGAPGVVETRVLQSEIRDWPLLVPASPRLVRAPTSQLTRSREGVLRWPPYEPALLYGVVHDGAGTLSAASRGAEETFTARAAALGLPGRLDPRVRVLASVLASDTSSELGRLQNTVQWLRSGYTYSLDVGEFETDDPLAEFLFRKKKGYCEYFATAAAVLLRLQGVPTRYVMGFSVGPQNFVPGRFGVGDHHLVRESDAHAWARGGSKPTPRPRRTSPCSTSPPPDGSPHSSRPLGCTRSGSGRGCGTRGSPASGLRSPARPALSSPVCGITAWRPAQSWRGSSLRRRGRGGVRCGSGSAHDAGRVSTGRPPCPGIWGRCSPRSSVTGSGRGDRGRRRGGCASTSTTCPRRLSPRPPGRPAPGSSTRAIARPSAGGLLPGRRSTSCARQWHE